MGATAREKEHLAQISKLSKVPQSSWHSSERETVWVMEGGVRKLNLCISPTASAPFLPFPCHAFRDWPSVLHQIICQHDRPRARATLGASTLHLLHVLGFFLPPNTQWSTNINILSQYHWGFLCTIVKMHVRWQTITLMSKSLIQI